MVEISEIVEEAAPSPPSQPTNNAADDRAQERLSDADEIESLSSQLSRPSAKLHVENLITKLRKEGKALQRVAASKSTATSSIDGAPQSSSSSQAAAAPPPAIPKRTPATSIPITSPTQKFQSFPTYYFDAGKYNSPTVSIYVPLDNIGSHDKSKVTCNFTAGAFDLIVLDYNNSNSSSKGTTNTNNYRLLNNNLEKDIDVSNSKYIIKPNKIIIKLGKVKGEYGSYDNWTQLTAKKGKSIGGSSSAGTKPKKDDPMGGIMDLMKDMYDSGDDNMKKMIGETMHKQVSVYIY